MKNIDIPEQGLPVENCRFCGARISHVVADLGKMPPANNYLTPEQSREPEISYPLTVLRCTECHLVQVGYLVPPSHLFKDYAYFSSYSHSWVEHARKFAVSATQRFDLTTDDLVLEVGCNDGYLLQHFRDMGVGVMGVDPATTVADIAIKKGIPTRVAFFGDEEARQLVEDGRQADLVIGNNVFAHVPDINGFTEGLRLVLKPDGVVSLEFPHLLRLLQQCQFDTIYHEHYSYYSFLAIENILGAHGLRVFEVEELKSHGGSIRVSACHIDSKRFEEQPGVRKVRALESEAGLDRPEIYDEFASRLPVIRASFNEFVDQVMSSQKHIVGYSAPAKGNTFLNFCGIGSDSIDFVADLNPAKQNHFLPGSRIPIRTPEDLFEAKPEYVLILAWNLRKEISKQLSRVAVWGGQFVVGIPFINVFMS